MKFKTERTETTPRKKLTSLKPEVHEKVCTNSFLTPERA
jgi:hypothetical protein